MSQKPLRNRVVVTGTGRCGTSFVMQVLTAAGAPTGFDSPLDRFYPLNMAGQETIIPTDASDERLSKYERFKVIKDPRLCFTLRTLLDNDSLSVAHAYVMIRDIHSASLSRIKKKLLLFPPGQTDFSPHPLLEGQTIFMYEAFGILMETLALNEIEHTFIEFPRCLEDPEYMFHQIRKGPLLENVSIEQFKMIHNGLCQPVGGKSAPHKMLLQRYKELGSIDTETASIINSEVAWDKQ